MPKITRGHLIAGFMVLAVLAAGVWFLVVPQFTLKHESGLPGDLGAACGDPGVAYTSAPAFTGPGPHATKMYTKLGKKWDSSMGPGSGLPASWQPKSTRDVQLIACVERTGDDGYLSSVDCEYGPRGLQPPNSIAPERVSMYDTLYRVTLREARTHKKVAQATLHGEDTKCPGTYDTSETAVDSHLSGKQLTDTFGRYTG